MRLVSIESGGDWTDASYRLINVGDDVDLAALKQQYRTWWRSARGQAAYQSFDKWLVSKGHATLADYEVVGDEL